MKWNPFGWLDLSVTRGDDGVSVCGSVAAARRLGAVNIRSTRSIALPVIPLVLVIHWRKLSSTIFIRQLFGSKVESKLLARP